MVLCFLHLRSSECFLRNGNNLNSPFALSSLMWSVALLGAFDCSTLERCECDRIQNCEGHNIVYNTCGAAVIFDFTSRKRCAMSPFVVSFTAARPVPFTDPKQLSAPDQPSPMLYSCLEESSDKQWLDISSWFGRTQSPCGQGDRCTSPSAAWIHWLCLPVGKLSCWTEEEEAKRRSGCNLTKGREEISCGFDIS